jgi:UDP-2,3-diacylglucosamine pyrophosphatase LpxH
MLVVLSDFHFQQDHFCTDRNLDPNALRLFFEQLARAAAKKKARELIVVLNGDIFDHIRNPRWLQENEEGLTFRPYEDHEPQKGEMLTEDTDAVAWDIHQAIESDPRVKESIALLHAIAHGDDDIFTHGPRPRFLYIPGTADRLANLSPRINARIREILNLFPPDPDHVHTNPPRLFPYQLLFAAGLPEGYPRAEDQLGLEAGSLDYATLVCHGHEFDWMSCEFNQDENLLGRILTPADSHLYALSPLSDWLAIDLICDLAYRFLQECGGEEQELIPVNREIYRCLLDAQDVRPPLRVLQYLMWRLDDEQWKRVRHIVRDVLKKARRHFRLKKWLTRHDRSWVPDRADKIQAALAALGRFGDAIPDSVLARIARRASTRSGPDEPPVELVRRDPIWECEEIHTLCLGHFHDPGMHTLTVLDGHPKIAVGTGTWRRRHKLCADEMSHIVLRTMAYAIFYRPEEQAATKSYRLEFWRGKTITHPSDPQTTEAEATQGTPAHVSTGQNPPAEPVVSDDTTNEETNA